MDKDNRIELSLEIVLLIGSAFLMCLEFFGSHTGMIRMAIRMGYCGIVGGMIAFAGYQAYGWYRVGDLRKTACRYALFYYGLYVLTGICRFWLVDQRPRVNSLVQILIFRKIPRYSEIYFVMMLVIMGSIWFMPVLYRFMNRKKMLAIIGLLMIGVTLFPNHIVGYPVLGAFLGTDVYRSFPILAYCYCYFIGGAIAKRHEDGKHLTMAETVIGLFVTIVVMIWKHSAIGAKMKFPLSYWEIVLSLGLVLLLFFVCQGVHLHAKLTVFSFEKTAGMIVLLHLLKVYGNLKQLKLIWLVLVFAVSLLVIQYLLLLFRYASQWIKEWYIQSEKTTWKYYSIYICAYTVCFFVLSWIVFLPFTENNATFLWCRDAISQYFPKAVFFSQNIRETLQSLAEGSFTWKMYDFSLGMGDTVIWSLDPIYWLYGLFKPENMETGYQFVTILRFYLIGVSISILLFYLKKGRKITLFCSFIYVFSGYALYAVVRHPQFAIPLTLLPLLIVAVEQIIREKHWHMGCVLIALSLLSNYYFLFMNTIALIIYFLVRFFCMEKRLRTVKQFFEYLRIFAGAYILGAGMGCMAIFTSVLAYVGSERTGAGVMSTESPFFYTTAWPTDVYMFLITTGRNAGNWLKTGFVPMAYLAVVLLFLRKGKKELKLLLGVCGLFILFPVAGYVMGGMGNVTNRWCYMLALLVTVIVAEMLPQISTMTRRELKGLLAAMLPYAAIALGYRGYGNKYTLKALSLLLITFIIFAFSVEFINLLTKRQMTVALSVLLVVSLWMNGDNMYSIEEAGAIQEYTEKGQAMEAATRTGIRALKDYDDESFYRVGETFSNEYQLCASMIMDVNSISYYNSTINGKIIDYNISMGNLMSALVDQRGLNNRAFMNALACVKYYGVEKLEDRQISKGMPYGYEYLEDRQVEGNLYAVYKNKYALPIGYTYNQILSRDEFETYTAAEKQEIMLTHAVIEEETELSQLYLSETPKLTAVKVPMDYLDIGECSYENGVLHVKAGTSITIYFKGLPNSETYLYLDGYVGDSIGDKDQLWFNFSSDNDSYPCFLRSVNNSYGLDRDEYVINAGYSEEGMSSVSLNCKTNGVINLNEIGIYCQPMDNYPEYIEHLKQDVLENVEISNNIISGTISLNEPKLLALSIPYQNGWTAYVDGEKADLLNVNIMYMGLELTPGEHTVVLEFEAPGLKLGLMITAVSVLIFAGLVFYERRKKFKNKTKEA